MILIRFFGCQIWCKVHQVVRLLHYSFIVRLLSSVFNYLYFFIHLFDSFALFDLLVPLFFFPLYEILFLFIHSQCLLCTAKKCTCEVVFQRQGVSIKPMSGGRKGRGWTLISPKTPMIRLQNITFRCQNWSEAAHLFALCFFVWQFQRANFHSVAGYSADKKAKVHCGKTSQDVQNSKWHFRSQELRCSQFGGGCSKKSQVVLINAGRLDFDQKLDLSKISAIADTGQW